MAPSGNEYDSSRGSQRDSSPELGTPRFKTQYSKKTGRPIRKSAGKAKEKAGFVDSKVIEDAYEEDFEPSSEDEDEDERPRSQQKRKRKRSPSPVSPPLEDVIRIENPGELSEDEGPFQKKSKLPPIVMQFNIPLGFHGPLYVKLDPNLLRPDLVSDMRPGRGMKKTDTLAEPPASRKKKSLGFKDLPAEMRNKIYRHLFVTTDKHFDFPPGKTNLNPLQRSSQFLSTCKLVFNEGCSVLYGENKFRFDRNGATRGSFWESVPEEIGYKDIRQFLRMIGPENLLYLRDVTLRLQDAMPAATPRLDHEQRRYIRDEHLVDVIRTLRQAKLRKINLLFLGRRALTRHDSKFVDYLSQIKADEVVSEKSNYEHQRIEPYLWKEIQDSMTRKKQLYLLEK